MITRMLLASMLAIGAAAFAGCDDMADCPSTVADTAACSANGLTCDSSGSSCTCSGGHWVCAFHDMPAGQPRDMTMRDLANPSD
jgi:hypothetical protein